ncbi:MAG: hypothetical protein GY795_07450 [Desulfobacterales bacterium]|nr:hypothetical protein [Desulfobacterales bacterium]
MQHTTKMVMVPQDAYSGLLSQQKQMYSPVVNQLSNLDQELQAIVSNPNIASDAKYHQYRQLFGRYQLLRNQQFPQSVPNFTKTSTDVQTYNDFPVRGLPIEERRLIDTLPKPSRRKGKILLDHIRQNDESFQWLDSGELVIDGTPIRGSNISDLVHHVTRNRPMAKPPEGAEEFTDLLEKTNVAKEAFNHSETSSTPFGLGTSFSPVNYSPMKTSTPKSVKKANKSTMYKSTRQSRTRSKPERFGNWVQYK